MNKNTNYYRFTFLSFLQTYQRHIIATKMSNSGKNQEIELDKITRLKIYNS